ncbi:MAG: pyridoxal phosphate-dependent aminotransferase [Bdellovibrionales bacterium]|nr:pyridoxal phosphate-dependent aminotransferase [Bdellovibrionales bacterium]
MSFLATPGFRKVPRTGVIYVMTKAAEQNYSSTDAAWANLGQGSPEEGALEGAPGRVNEVLIDMNDHQYASVEGLLELRQRVADFYNQEFRSGKSSKYTHKNVAICGGGRLALTRIAAAIKGANMGHFLPDYTAYEELLTIFRGFNPIPLLLKKEENYKMTAEKLEEQILGLGLSVILISNPCNPTGQVLKGEELNGWVAKSRSTNCTMIFDEFYSHYIYNEQAGYINSAARFVDDINSDPVIIVDGLTKNWRYPGWRISWIVGPEQVIESVSSVASFLDGGANRPFQRKAVELFQPEWIKAETLAIQNHFTKKRSYMLERIKNLPLTLDAEPEGSFYFWVNLDQLPGAIRDGHSFFEECLKENVIVVPGIYFDVNPGNRRSERNSKYHNYCRLSFGPSLERLEVGMDSIERVIKKF